MKHVFCKGGFISLGTGFKAVPGLKVETSAELASGGIALEGEKTWKESRSCRGLVKEDEKHYTLTVSGSVGLNARVGYNFNIESDKTSKYHIPDGKISVEESGHSLLQMGEIIAAPRFFNWNIGHWPPQDMNFNDKQQVKESVRSWITEAKNGDFGVTYLRHGHVVAIKGIEGDNVVCINSLRQHEEPEERVSLDDIVNALTQNKANFAKFKPA
jgi:hypothetical protein